MLPAFRSLAIAACLGAAAACARAPDGDAATAPAGPAPDAGFAGFSCADGVRFQARFGDYDATLRWPDGRVLTLPRAESASKADGDVYVGDAVSLQRDATRLQLHDGTRAATECTPAPANGAMAQGAA